MATIKLLYSLRSAAIALLIFIACESLQSQVIQTQYGPIEGVKNGTIYQFLGVPFAKPPVDSLRWKEPREPNSWTDTLLAASFAPVCPQKEFQQGDTTYTLKGDEDCLYLNIWTPQTQTADLPVMVFIHGGGNQQGGASETNGGTQMYFGKNLSERGNVVVVTIQYRLGPLGFLVHPGLEAENENGVSGNYAVLDQVLALHWIKNNIAGFGGDPSNVMIFGESAGGVTVGNLMLTPLAAGLFHRACIESAIPDVKDYSETKNNGIAYVDSFINTGNDVQKIEYLRSLSSDSLLYFETSPVVGGVLQLKWRPVADGVVFNDIPKNTIETGQFNKVPLIIGTNSEEMSLSAPKTVLPVMVTALVNSTVPSEYQSAAHQLYPSGSNQTEARNSYIGILTDGQFTSPVRRTAQCISQNQAEPVWRYLFSHKHTVSQLEVLGSYHGMELFYIFNNWENATLGTGVLFKPADDSVQQVMLKYWTNFAKSGNPNGSGLAAWPEYESQSDCYLEIKATPDGSQCGLRTEKSDLWDDVTGFTGCTSTYTIAAEIDPPGSGTVTGSGTYLQDETVTLAAIPESTFSFVNWTENGLEVSSNATYSFTANNDRLLIANFQKSTGINENESVENLVIYPNPGTDIFNIELPEEIDNFEIVVYNSIGNIIMDQKNTRQVNLEGKYNGIYFIEVRFETGRIIKRIIKTE